MDIERRVFRAELREEGEGEIVGYAAVFNQPSEDLGGFVEVIEPGAFRDVLDDDVRALFNHDSNYVLGRNRAGTLGLAEDDRGLESRIKPPATQWANDLLVSMRRGDVDQMSFGFSVETDDWKKDEAGIVRRTIKKIGRLYDVSVVTFPAYPQTTVAVRSKVQELTAADAQEGGAADSKKAAGLQGRHAARRRTIDILRRI